MNIYSAYSNAVEEDLWNTLEEQAAIDGVILPDSLAKIMAPWTQTTNYPLITVKRTYIEGDGALVTQVRLDLIDISLNNCVDLILFVIADTESFRATKRRRKLCPRGHCLVGAVDLQP